ncbi:MAG TPA: dTMP kinase [Gammaproteobacteria bacterium]|nr:dTMP kinase [Gammaproteobacteria bacterium]
MTRGRFITIEGLEGAGKTTCIERLRRLLAERGQPAVFTREPGGTSLGESIRGLLLDHRAQAMDPQAEALLVFAARAEHLARVILPALEDGRWVVCDRFTDATFAYQGGGRGIPAERIAVLERWTQGDLRPDRTLFLDVPVDQGLSRAATRGEPDRFERERAAFFERARTVYLDRCRAEPARMRRIDASRSAERVGDDVVAEVEALLGP